MVNPLFQLLQDFRVWIFWSTRLLCEFLQALNPAIMGTIYSFFVPSEVPHFSSGYIMIPMLKKSFLSVSDLSDYWIFFTITHSCYFLLRLRKNWSCAAAASCCFCLVFYALSHMINFSYHLGQGKNATLRLWWLWSVNDLCTGPGSKPFLGSFETQFKRTQLNICVSI